MKKIFGSLFVALLALVVLVSPVYALQAEMPNVGDALTQTVQIVAGMIGAAMFIPAFLNALKAFGVLPDGYAAIVNLGLQLCLYGGVFAAIMLGKADFLPALDTLLGNLGAIVAKLVILLGGVAGGSAYSAGIHAKLKAARLPLIGYSYSKK